METHSQCRQTWSNSAFRLAGPDLIWQFVEQKNMPVTTVWVSVPKYKRTSGLHLSTKRHKNNHTDKKKNISFQICGIFWCFWLCLCTTCGRYKQLWHGWSPRKAATNGRRWANRHRALTVIMSHVLPYLAWLQSPRRPSPPHRYLPWKTKAQGGFHSVVTVPPNVFYRS